MKNKEWLTKQIETRDPEDVYDLLMEVINIGNRYNHSRKGVAKWLMEEVEECRTSQRPPPNYTSEICIERPVAHEK